MRFVVFFVVCITLIGCAPKTARVRQLAPVTVTAVWDRVDGENHETATWQLEVDGVIMPCPFLVLTDTERSCGPVTVSLGTHRYRLRGVNFYGNGDWTPEIIYTISAPGAFTIRAVFPT